MARRPLTGVLLVGGASRRFGSPKALAELDGQTLAERGWRALGEACDERLAVGKQADGLPLPFPLLDDGAERRHPVAGILAGLRAASNDVCVFLPVDHPFMTADALRALGEACADAAIPRDGGPLPGAYARRTAPILERCLAADGSIRHALADLDVRHVDVDPAVLANVNVPGDLEAAERRATAVDAAVTLAARHGLRAASPRVLSDWNDTVVHLAPHPVVARVATSWIAWDKEETYRREVAVATHATERGGPCARPSAVLPPGPHRANGLVVAFWEHLEAEPGEPAPTVAGPALRALHESLADFDGPLPPLAGRLDQAATTAGGLERVDPADRDLLRSTMTRFGQELADRAHDQRVLHGGPHGSNLVVTRAGPRWIDLDTVCRGPLEWDLAHLPAEAAAAFPEADLELLDVVRGLVSAEVAIWCWRSYGRAREVDDAAHFHLDRVRKLAAG